MRKPDFHRENPEQRISIVLGGVVLRVDPDPNLSEFCLFLFFAEFYFLTVLIFWIKSSEFCWFLFFGNIGITFFDVLIFWNSKIFSPPALENQCKSLVYPL